MMLCLHISCPDVQKQHNDEGDSQNHQKPYHIAAGKDKGNDGKDNSP